MRRWPVRRKFSHTVPNFTTFCRRHSALAQKIEHTPVERPQIHPPPIILSRRPDPYVILASELSQLRGNLLTLLGSAHPGLKDLAQCYFLDPTKLVRSLVILLFARATNGLGEDWEAMEWNAAREVASGRTEEFEQPLTRGDVLHYWNPSMPDHAESFDSIFPLQTPAPFPHSLQAPSSNPPSTRPYLLPTQIRVAQIVEMIQIASMLHDEISVTTSSTQGVFSNKLAILGGDFLLGRASAALSRLGDSEVVELVASVISNLVEGRVIELKTEYPSSPLTPRDAWHTYFKTTYLKTGSLLAKGARSAVILGGCRNEIWKEVAYAFGRNIGVALQLVDDAREHESCVSTSTRPRTASSPILFAWEEHPALGPLIERGFTEPEDAAVANDLVRRSCGIDRTWELVHDYVTRASNLLRYLPDSDSRLALDLFTQRIAERTS
ncbi:terpenoid synthase [Armillaria borealis]|uniref:Terpenoid synthase n=1 Tax=Armillaria borealis TaxID=47425 RepID=A0AA39K7B4_9AGAR|nr:terpenoid synthase [Armillaria borealis]